MRSPSVPTQRGLVHWQGLLLVVSLLNLWNQPTTAQVTVESKDALEGNDVRLRIHPETPNAVGFQWYSGRTIESHNHIAYLLGGQGSHIRFPPGDQVMVEGDGTLLLKSVTVKNSGYYTVVVQLKGCQQMIACGRLDVYPLVSAPTLFASNTTVTENKDAVVMTCHTNAHSFQWYFKGTSLMLTERMKLTHDGKVLTINPVLREDAGGYRCKGFNPRSSATSNKLKLVVKSE